MSNTGTVVDVIHLPRNFERLGNVSMSALLSDSGYSIVHEQITEDAILETLKEHPDCVRDWMAWSEDKRSSSGWSFRSAGKLGFEVAYLSECGDVGEVNEYADAISACAAFIKREIELIRASVNR